MVASLDISVFERLDMTQETLNSITESLLHTIQEYLGIPPYYSEIKALLEKKIHKSESVFDLGVIRKSNEHTMTLTLDQSYEKFIPFILLREVFNIFIPPEIRFYESVQLTLNSMLVFLLSKHTSHPEWNKLIRQKVEEKTHLSTGWHPMTIYDRLINFYRIQHHSFTPIPFFFRYLRENAAVISEKMRTREYDIHAMLQEEFEKHLIRDMEKDELIEAIRCVHRIFEDKKRFTSLMSYYSYFQEFKDSRQLTTDLSQRKFIHYLDWMKNSVMAPSYRLNYNQFDQVAIEIICKFNPQLANAAISKILEGFPFLYNTQSINIGFSPHYYLSFLIPGSYIEKFKHIFKRMQTVGYINAYHIYTYNQSICFYNLNFWRQFSHNARLLDNEHRSYDKKYELEVSRDFGSIHSPRLTLLEFLVLDRIQWYGVTGWGFERSAEQLNRVKEDLLNEIVEERSRISRLKEILVHIHTSNTLLKEFVTILTRNKEIGFFSIKDTLEEDVQLLLTFEECSKTHPHIQNLLEFQRALKQECSSPLLNKNILLSDKKRVNKLLDLYLTSKEVIERYKLYEELFSLFSHLKLFNLQKIKNIVSDRTQIEVLFATKEKRLKKSQDKYKLYDMTSQEVEAIIDKFLGASPPMISPSFIGTIPWQWKKNVYSGSMLILYVIDCPENEEKLRKLVPVFPILYQNRDIDMLTQQQTRCSLFQIPLLTPNEKKSCMSILFNLFGHQLLYSLVSTLVVSPAFSLRHFYDFEHNQFFYTDDLFEEYFKFVSKILGEKISTKQIIPYTTLEKLWENDIDIKELITNTNRRAKYEQLEELKNHAHSLFEFRNQLIPLLLDVKQFKLKKEESYFQNYIKSIKFIPAFHSFGFSQYYLFITPTNLNELDFRLLFLNSFQSVHHALQIDGSIPFLIKYIMPYGNPNRKYLNRLTKSERIIQDYCLFTVKKMHCLFQFHYNTIPEGWDYDKDMFQKYVQNILFNPSYAIHIPSLHSFDLGSKRASSFLGPSTKEFQALTRIYAATSLDVKAYIGTTKRTIVNDITTLLQKGLIFPYVSLKNVELHNIIRLIIPNTTPEINNTLLKIFSYFNYGFFYEIEGQYFIHGFPKEESFENGLYLKLYFPQCELVDFITLFEQLFEYLKIPHYLILTDFCKGDILLKNVYGETLHDYHPLKNLIWNEKDKRWMNHKLYKEKMEKVYPDLRYFNFKSEV